MAFRPLDIFDENPCRIDSGIINLPPHLQRMHVHLYIFFYKYAKIAQLVERDLAKVEVAGSNPVFRSKCLLGW